MNRHQSPSRSPSPPRTESRSNLGYRTTPTLAPKLTPEKTPQFIYGTAWKKERTADLVYKALRAGFRAVDTANQPKHYYEKGVGDAVQKAVQDGVISSREELYLQTKFTSIDGQDPNHMPYQASQPLQEQVRTSVAKSLEHLQTNYIDCLVLHGPLRTFNETMTVWKTMEEFIENGTVLALGVSNVYSPSYLKKIYENAEYKPTVVQNRFYAETNYDVIIRAFCDKHNIKYQSFWTLSANPHITHSAVVQSIAKKKEISPENVLYRWMMANGCQVLNGTTSELHMREDLDALSVDLDPNEIESISQLL